MKFLSLLFFALSVNGQCHRENACRPDGGVVGPGQDCRPNTDYCGLGACNPVISPQTLETSAYLVRIRVKPAKSPRNAMDGLRPTGTLIAMSTVVPGLSCWGERASQWSWNAFTHPDQLGCE
ncbi:hypothetical protein DL95DRAFT_470599 [Leptodontidium sp. 2 PMI_412]|nr:hypothetical protein BKA61DRAFT_678690 [Leptodontidium sp. MPI-SDFR-AT-0119]KAH9205417.1 hypothetical protein DL95DRAFT_470599 [Leptodontidium sp. 2 PMI_412]